MKSYVKQAVATAVVVAAVSALASRSVAFRDATNSESGGGFFDKIAGYIGF